MANRPPREYTGYGDVGQDRNRVDNESWLSSKRPQPPTDHQSFGLMQSLILSEGEEMEMRTCYQRLPATDRSGLRSDPSFYHLLPSKRASPRSRMSPRDAQRGVSKRVIKEGKEIAKSRQRFLTLMIGSEGR